VGRGLSVQKLLFRARVSKAKGLPGDTGLSKSVLPGPAVSTPPLNVLELQILRSRQDLLSQNSAGLHRR
jgi:hypothetical protein